MSEDSFIFSTEAVSEGHPDKLCDAISDMVLDACIAEDPESKVACECFVTTGMVLVGGEITTETYVDIPNIARQVVKEAGYTKPEYGFDYEAMAVLTVIHSQSADIIRGVSGNGLEEYAGKQGAGDQGMMFGFACNETEEAMPIAFVLANKILQEAAEKRKNSTIAWLRPDSKSQISIEYKNNRPVRIAKVVLSHQHDEAISYKEIKEILIEEVIKPVLQTSGLMNTATEYIINPTGRFVIGGPAGDTGLTGRKIIADSYGGMCRHGGGAFSGKDPSKVDRSAAYAARYVAKNIVKAGIAKKCEIQLAYAIGVPEPVSIMIDCFGTAKVPNSRIKDVVIKNFDLSPAGIIKALDLKKPIYNKTATYGHFGKSGFSWEKTDMIQVLQTSLG